jgi:hypothetical protein
LAFGSTAFGFLIPSETAATLAALASTATAATLTALAVTTISDIAPIGHCEIFVFEVQGILHQSPFFVLVQSFIHFVSLILRVDFVKTAFHACTM